MPNVDQEFEQELALLKHDVEIGRQNVMDFNKRHLNHTREHAIIYCLERATDLGQGCVLAAEAKLVTSLQILARGLMECIFWTCWVTQSDENAQQFEQASINEVKRLIRKSLAITHHGVIKDKITGEDKSEEFLQSPFMKDIAQRLKIEDVAKNVGLEELYTLYGPISMLAHGSAFGVAPNQSADDGLFAFVSSAGVFMQCVNTVASNWIVRRQLTSTSEVRRILKI